MSFCQHLDTYNVQNIPDSKWYCRLLRLATWNHKLFCETLRGFVFLMGTKSLMTRHQQTGLCNTSAFFWGAGQTSCFMSKNEGNQVVVCDVSGVKYSKPWLSNYLNLKSEALSMTKHKECETDIFASMLHKKEYNQMDRTWYFRMILVIWHQWLEHEWFWYWQWWS